MKKVNKIPKFNDYAEEAKFWDTHDFSEFLNQSDKVKLKVNLKSAKKETLTVRLQSELKLKLGEVAQEMGTQPSTLARMWLVEKLKALHLA